MTKFYNRFIRPFSDDPYSAARETVLNYTLLGLISLTVVALLNTLAGLLFAHYEFVIARLFTLCGVAVVLGLFYYLERYRHYVQPVAFLLVLVTFLCAGLMANQWGLLLPAPLLLFALAIVMAGILISSRFSLFAAAASLVLLSGLQVLTNQGVVKPDLSWMRSTSTFGDVIGYGGFYFSIAFLTWLFNRQMEFSLLRAKRAEAQLVRQNDQLEGKVIKRTRELEKEQLERMQQMYRFAELGHVSTALFHDLANHLSSVSLDIENLHKKTQPEILSRIDDNIQYIDNIVQRVRSQLQGKIKVERFDIKEEVREVARVSAHGAEAMGVTLELIYENDKPIVYRGDILRFRQVIINLISNAIESYKDSKKSGSKRRVVVTVKAARNAITIEISDFGTGIPASIRDQVFDPFYTSKEKGIGIGLFLVKQMVERDFKGDVTLVKTGPAGTTFAVSFPQKQS